MNALKGVLLAVICIFFTSANGRASYSYYDFEQSTDLNFEVLVELIKDKQLASVEQTLKELKAYYPNYFETYILMYKSRSLQDASFENPRALLFDRSAQFVFSFNGNPSQKGYNRLEIMQFRENEDRFEFREIAFNDGEVVEISEANPRKCMVCHQSTTRKNIDPRPNWEPYNTWPGAYGSLNGDLRLSNHDRSELKERGGDISLFEDAEREGPMLEKFFEEVQSTHQRYKYLNAEKYDVGLTTDFTQFTANLNFRRVVRIISEQHKQIYDKYFQLAFLALVKCKQVPLGKEALNWAVSTLPLGEASVPTLKDKNREPSKYAIEARARQLFWRERGKYGEETWTEEEFAEKVKEVSEELWWIYENSPTLDISEAITLMFEPFGIDTEDWSMDFRTKGSLAFLERFGTPSNTKRTLRDAYIRRFGKGSVATGLTCTEISKKAAAQFSTFMQSEEFRQLQEAKIRREAFMSRALKGRCVKCHTSYDEEIPYIPFDDEEALSRNLNQPAKVNSSLTLLEDIKLRMSDMATEEQRMPMGPVFSKRHREDLVRYFEALATGSQD